MALWILDAHEELHACSKYALPFQHSLLIHIQFLLPLMDAERVEMEATPQSHLDVGIVNMETGCPFCLLTGKNVRDGRSRNRKSAALCPVPHIQPS